MPWSITVPASALPFLYLLLSVGKNLKIQILSIKVKKITFYLV